MNIAALDLNLLVAFEALMRERSVSKAGARIGLSQPAMSNALARLRGALGDRLFVAKNRQMVPTARARHLAGPVGEALSRIRSAIGDRDRFDPQRDTASFRLATTDYAEIVLISRVLDVIRRAASGVTLTISRLEAQFEIPREELHDGSLQFAVGLFPQPIVPGTGITSKILFEDSWVCVAQARHPKIRGKLSLETFLRSEHVRVAHGASERPGLIGGALASLGKTQRIGVTVPHLATVPVIASRTDLLGIVPLRLAKEYAAALKLKIYPIPVPLPKAALALVWDEGRQHDPAHAWMRRMITGPRTDGPRY